MGITRLLILCFSCVSCLLEGATFRLILVGDTLDLDLGRAVACDVENVRNHFFQMATLSGMEYEEHIYTGRTFRSEKVWEGVKTCLAEEDDCLVFYFSGHGFRTDEMTGLWPHLHFGLEHKGLDVEEIICELHDKKARLTIIVVDACNRLLPEEYAPRLLRKASSRPLDQRGTVKKYAALFLRPKGQVVITSSQPGTSSWTAPEGSLFTSAFLKELQQSGSRPFRPQWEEIFERTSDRLTGYQTPIYSVHIEQ